MLVPFLRDLGLFNKASPRVLVVLLLCPFHSNLGKPLSFTEKTTTQQSAHQAESNLTYHIGIYPKNPKNTYF